MHSNSPSSSKCARHRLPLPACPNRPKDRILPDHTVTKYPSDPQPSHFTVSNDQDLELDDLSSLSFTTYQSKQAKLLTVTKRNKPVGPRDLKRFCSTVEVDKLEEKIDSNGVFNPSFIPYVHRRETCIADRLVSPIRIVIPKLLTDPVYSHKTMVDFPTVLQARQSNQIKSKIINKNR
ncbi:hypothetical protein CROQUDRAFT_99200 [Cronartium quercuum f. sp. fusiforme G11]|uniref:Uncharacterized protein n=1 Tax=Cronartium quercuum f. sp. fusiforme G11 TaxID=708437 RepID=A0A9P6T743_9BASI|nr:hypothetical protein CROQUDRAFT_99200 [Cronartium quercuum f. sp. fusiforme G11]